MNVLVVGSGGREHALIWKLSQSRKIHKLYCAPGNGGISRLAQCVPVKATDIDDMVDFAKKNDIDFVVVAPDDPLALGMVDALEKSGIPAFGPYKNAAEIESSKVFSKGLMKKYGIPTAGYAVFDDAASAIAYIRKQGAPIVIKADGLALGKGVIIAQTVSQAEQAVMDMLEQNRFGAAGARVVIEEYMTGPEVTVLAFTDGETLVPMPASQDHKRAFDGDEGLNTGGMGAICPPVCYTPEVAAQCMNEIFLPTMRAMNAEGRPFKGVLYFGLMLTPKGPRVIEYNARFGDPEAQAVLFLLETDLLDILRAVSAGQLKDVPVHWRTGASCCVVLASGGYPGSYQTGYPIEGLAQAAAMENVYVFHAGTRAQEETVVTSGGRVLGVTACAQTLRDAVALSYQAARCIRFENMHMRTDIGGKNL